MMIDIGGQDSKVISLDADGRVVDFAMNDKCAAGTGRFLEVMARALEIELDQLGPVSLKHQKAVVISSMCTVFAESEVVSLIAEGYAREDILNGLHDHALYRAIWRTRQQRYSLKAEVCDNCHQAIFPPRDVCPHCAQERQHWSISASVVRSTLSRPCSTRRPASRRDGALHDGARQVGRRADGHRGVNRCRSRAGEDRHAGGEMVTRKLTQDGDEGQILYGVQVPPTAPSNGVAFQRAYAAPVIVTITGAFSFFAPSGCDIMPVTIGWRHNHMAKETRDLPVVGIDLGGTKILAGVVNAKGKIIGLAKRATKPEDGVEAVVERMAKTVREAVSNAELSSGVSPWSARVRRVRSTPSEASCVSRPISIIGRTCRWPNC